MADKITIATYNKIATFYESKHNTKNFWTQEYKEFERSISGKRVLDVGCGFGRDSKHFVNKGFDVTGIDASVGMLRLAKKNVPSAKFLHMDMLKLSFKTRSFDGIWCCASLLHIPKKDAPSIIRRFKHILRPEGLLFISVKKGKGERYRTYPDGTMRFFSFYSENYLKRIIEEAGFKVLSLHKRKDTEGDTWLTILAILPSTA